MTISDNIRSLRLKKRLSQEKLEELLNVSGQAVSKWEQGASHSQRYHIKLTLKLLATILLKQ